MLSNTSSRYGSIAKLFHWVTALGILFLIPLGLVAHNMPAGTVEEIAAKTTAFSLHKTVGVTVFFVALLRILWALSQPKPRPLHDGPAWQLWLAETVHWLLYGSLVLVPLSGWVHHAALDGFAPIWWPFGQDLPFVPKSDWVADVSGAAHALLNLVLGAAILLHVAGALKHHVVDRDATLRRMLPGRVEAPVSAAHPRHWPAALTAVVVWAAVIGGGAVQAMIAPDRGPAALSAPVQSDWQVTEGRLGITVQQFGSAVDGEFADWTAAIRFAPRDSAGEAGDVDVTVAIGSLTLGSVTDMAIGGDYLDAAAFPTARYSGPIVRDDTGAYRVEGQLEMRGVTLALPLPFEIEIADGLATVSGGLQIDRRDVTVGLGVTDEGQLANAVQVGFDLKASKATE